MSNPASALFAQTWSDHAASSASAPGRANLIGEHTDYNGGPVLPFAIEQRTWVAVGTGDGPAWKAVSSFDGQVHTVIAGGRMPRAWTAYLAGVIRAFSARGVELPPAVRVAVASTVPVGAGLSSSAALTVALVRALASLAGIRLTRVSTAELAFRAEHDHVGVQCGRMDQTIAAFAQRGHALLIEAGTGPRRQLPFGRAVLMVDTGRSHRLVSGALNDRQAECAEALAVLRGTRSDLIALAELSEAEFLRLSNHLPRVLARRVRHVVTETGRVREAASALAQNRFQRLGELLVDGHNSLRDDFAASCAEADAIVEWAVGAGAWGARLTGAGWGGAVLVLAPEAAMQEVRDTVTDRFLQRFGTVPASWTTHASAGLRVEHA